MVELDTVKIGDRQCNAVTVRLPKTTVLTVATDRGYIMCGMLAIERLDNLRPERSIISARVTHVKTIAELLDGTVDAVSRAARELGVREGMTGRQALEKML